MVLMPRWCLCPDFYGKCLHSCNQLATIHCYNRMVTIKHTRVSDALLTPPPPICRRLSLWHRLLCLSSVRLVVPSPRFSCRHLPSASASASHHAVASCHAPLGPLVRLVKVSPLLTPPPPICGIIESSQRSGLMLVPITPSGNRAIG